MFRRFRRPIGARMNPQIVQAMQQAQALVAQGKPAQAASLLAQISRQVGAANHPLRAANLQAKAAHLFVDAGDAVQALAEARLALDGFLALNNGERCAQFYARISNHLEQGQMEAAKVELEKVYGTRVAGLPAIQRAPAVENARRGRLPAACPQCNAPVRPDEVEWIDAQTAECSYCGAILQPQL